MRIVDRETFLEMPEGTVFRKYEPMVFGYLCVKGETYEGGRGDFRYYALDDIEADDPDNGDELLRKMHDDPDMEADIGFYSYRDGLFDEDQMFAVYSMKDVERICEFLRGGDLDE